MIVPPQRAVFVQELLIAELLARRGQGPLARKRWPPPRPRSRDRAPIGAASRELDPSVVPSPSAAEPKR